MSQKLILITNDDGIQAKGLKTLVHIAQKYGQVVVVAPDGPRSAQSNALTIDIPIFYQCLQQTDNLTIYQCSGTPTDCVKLALNCILKTQKPDLLLSGINHGSNSAINVIYSGTMGSVLEGCEQQIQSIGFSLCDHNKEADFSHTETFFSGIIEQTLQNPLPAGVCLNVNAPTTPIKGIRIARQTKGQWIEEYDTCRKTDGTPYFWLTGNLVNLEPDCEDTDEWALKNGYISIVPTQIDMTHYSSIEKLKSIYNAKME